MSAPRERRCLRNGGELVSDKTTFMSLRDEIKAAIALADEADRTYAELEAKRTEVVTRSADDMGMIYKVHDNNAFIDPPAPETSSIARDLVTSAYVKHGLETLADIVAEEFGKARRELEARIAVLERLVGDKPMH